MSSGIKANGSMGCVLELGEKYKMCPGSSSACVTIDTPCHEEVAKTFSGPEVFGIICGVFLVLVIIASMILFRMWRKRRHERKSNSANERWSSMEHDSETLMPTWYNNNQSNSSSESRGSTVQSKTSQDTVLTSSMSRDPIPSQETRRLDKHAHVKSTNQYQKNILQHQNSTGAVSSKPCDTFLSSLKPSDPVLSSSKPRDPVLSSSVASKCNMVPSTISNDHVLKPIGIVTLSPPYVDENQNKKHTVQTNQSIQEVDTIELFSNTSVEMKACHQTNRNNHTPAVTESSPNIKTVFEELHNNVSRDSMFNAHALDFGDGLLCASTPRQAIRSMTRPMSAYEIPTIKVGGDLGSGLNLSLFETIT